MHEKLGMSRVDLLTTFNCGAGYAAIMRRGHVERALGIASGVPIIGEERVYGGKVVGKVVAGDPGTYFEPWDIFLPPPGD